MCVRLRGPLWDAAAAALLLAALNTDRPKGVAPRSPPRSCAKRSRRAGDACRPRIARPTLAAAFIDPALRLSRGARRSLPLGRRLRAIDVRGRTAPSALDFAERRKVSSAGDEAVILAVPPWVARELVPDLTAPDEFRAIVNAHFKIAAAARHAARCWAWSAAPPNGSSPSRTGSR